VAANDPGAICLLANCYFKGLDGFPQDQLKAIELFSRAADLGFSKAHSHLGMDYYEVGDMKKAKFHYEAAAMAVDELARNNLGRIEIDSRNMQRA
jgi:TPR repeat protein